MVVNVVNLAVELDSTVHEAQVTVAMTRLGGRLGLLQNGSPPVTHVQIPRGCYKSGSAVEFDPVP